MKPKILITQWMPPEGIALLEDYCELEYCNIETPLSKKELIERGKDKDGLIIFMSDIIDREVIECCPKLRVISSFGKGYDNIDVDCCTSHGIAVTINKSSLTEDTADLAIALALANTRNILPGDNSLRDGVSRGWHPRRHLGRRFHHATLGLLGFGSIGAAIALRAKGFSMNICYYDPTITEAWPDVQRCEQLEEMLRQCDFLIITANLNPDSLHLINEENLRCIKKGASVINIARGSIVDEAAIAHALKTGLISGYAADVFAFEDRLIESHPDDIPAALLNNIEETILTPHLGTGTIEARIDLSISTATGLLAVLRGEPTAQQINRLHFR